MDAPRSSRSTLFRVWWLAALAGYLVAAAWQLGSPGLHYDEAREAGQNAMELLTGAPVMAFRGAALHAGGVDLPLMVQDYIGALNVYLALPFLAATGVGVPNLRALGVLTGLLALVLLERTVSEWLTVSRYGPTDSGRIPLSAGGMIALTLTALSPSFVFWSRQGVFVTNLTQPLALLCLWMGLRWWRTDRRLALYLSAFAAGLALYAKLLAVWVVLPFALLMLVAWWRLPRSRPRLTWRVTAIAALCFLAPLLPLIAFNAQTGGALGVLDRNLARSYYGVNNLDLAANLAVRLSQLWQTLEGSHFWYLGGPFANRFAPWMAILLVVAGVAVAWRRVLPPLLLLALALLLSLFTVSDLFITHYALLLPLALGCAGVAAGAILERAGPGQRMASALVALLVAICVLMDAAAIAAYHRALAQTGGLGDHSDASYALAYHLRMNGMGAPITLDWGMDATVRFLSEGAVTPIEIFGYASPQQPDAQFADRLSSFLENPGNVYLLRAEGSEVFAGRRAVLQRLAAEHGLSLNLERTFAQRDGTPLYEIWKAARQ